LARVNLSLFSLAFVTEFAFGLNLLGTAAIVSPVNKIGYQGKDIEIPVEEDGMGPVSRPIWADLVARQTGETESDWSVVVHE
jgi:branched-chain amino acid aminotransferase